MSTSLLYHAFGIRGYQYVRTDYWALTQHSRHEPQSSGLDFAEVPKEVRTGRSSPETASTHGRFRSAEPKGEIADLGRTVRKWPAG